MPDYNASRGIRPSRLINALHWQQWRFSSKQHAASNVERSPVWIYLFLTSS